MIRKSYKRPPKLAQMSLGPADVDDKDASSDRKDNIDPVAASPYLEQHIPETTALGEVLLAFADTNTNTCRPRSAVDYVWDVIGRSSPWYVHMILCTGVLLVWWFTILAIYNSVSSRFAQFGTVLLLVICSAMAYCFLSWLLMRIPMTAEIGYRLWWRHKPKDDDAAVLGTFLETCTWLALVVGTYGASQNPFVAVILGGISGLWVAATGDFLLAYIRVQSAVIKDEAQPLWLKYTVTTVCLGYIVVGLVRLFYNFLVDNNVESMVLQYLLSILVGVSLVVLSEVLLLYSPTRYAGVILQSRVVHAKTNWSSHPLRSLVELAFVFAATVVLYDYLDDFVVSLQAGTLASTIFILCGEFYFYPSATPASHDVQNDHWIKMLPLGSLIVFMLYQLALVLSWQSFLAMAEVGIVAFVAKLLRAQTLWGRFQEFLRNLVAWPIRTTMEVLAHCVFLHILPRSISTWTHVISTTVFDLGLVHCQSTGLTLWHGISALQYSPSWVFAVQLKRTRSIDEIAPLHNWMWEAVDEPDAQTSSIRVPISIMANLVVVVTVLLSGLRYGTLLLSRISGVVPVVMIAGFLALCAGTLIGVLTCSSHPTFRLLRRVLFTSIKQQCSLHPLHVLVQVVVCLGVFVGTYAISGGAWSSAALFASASAIGVIGGGQYVVRRLSTHETLDATYAVIFFVVLLSYAVGVSLFCIYVYIDRIEIAFCLATLSGVVFVASSELFLMWEPTRVAGIILQTRVTQCVHNWRVEPLRSFLECLVWIAVTYGTFIIYQDFVVALHLGTLSGIVVTLAGEVFRNRWLFPQPPSEHMDQRPKVLPLVLLFAYVGAGTFQWIFEHLRSLEVTVGLATVAGIIFLCVADVLAMWQPTRWAGVILQDRFLNASEHWQLYPVRSFVEVGCFLGVIYGSYAIYGDLSVAVQCGTFSGMLVALIGEQLKSQRKLRSEDKPQYHILPFPIISVLGFVGCVAFNTIYTHLRSIEVAFALATASGVAFVVLGDMFVFWAPTRFVGLILQERTLHFTRDMRLYSWRCWWELCTCTMALYVSYSYLWRGDLLVAIQVCTFTAILVCVVGEVVLSSIQKYEQSVVQQGRWEAQAQSKLLGLPYEVLFETARFLTPEELLVTRTTCHKINSLLRAESKRFWLHATLRRQYGRAMQQTHRSLIYAAWKAIIPKVFAPREPLTVLNAKITHNRALKWVFLNADWIRRQNMPRRTDKIIELGPGDVGFDVFRHMPDKTDLAIQVEQNQMLETTRLTVPGHIYSKIQADPFSFVVSETLYEVEELSFWHICTVVFVAMVVVSIAQAALDISTTLGYV
ncbi:hypothetical protein LEN26_000881 [Aphanomyces euteiches]|nr:hypothetical protein LEN26_000881 [Aphanomyces euteiches]